MADTSSLATTSTDTTLIAKQDSKTESLATSSTDTTAATKPSSSAAPAGKESKHSWRDKIHRSKSEEPGKEKWRDASLSEEERWKEWQKAKDKEQKKK